MYYFWNSKKKIPYCGDFFFIDISIYVTFVTLNNYFCLINSLLKAELTFPYIEIMWLLSVFKYRKPNCSMISFVDISGTWTDQWCPGQDSTIQHPSWTRTPWTNVRERDGSSSPSTFSHSSTIYTGNCYWSRSVIRSRLIIIFLQNDLLLDNSHSLNGKSQLNSNRS